MDSRSLDIIRIGGMGCLEWRCGGEKQGFTPWLIRHVRHNWSTKKLLKQRRTSSEIASLGAHT